MTDRCTGTPTIVLLLVSLAVGSWITAISMVLVIITQARVAQHRRQRLGK